MNIFPNSHTPIYQQIIDQVKARILGDNLAAGECLPSVRRLAEELLVNPNTVARAYRELEHAGFVVTRPGAGVYVADQSSPFRARQRLEILEEHIDRLLDVAAQVDVDARELQRLLRERSAERAAQRATEHAAERATERAAERAAGRAPRRPE